ncbi:MAG: peptidoglycan glycosyltransferase [Lachnospiraceae bacterium]|nr:peptidoglycan glycosyltransferase [Lachnospiraceae bacterium]
MSKSEHNEKVFERVRIFHKKKLFVYWLFILCACITLTVRLGFLMIMAADDYGSRAIDVQERERDIKAARGRILDINGVVLADNTTVCTVSVIHSQIEDPEAVIAMLCRELSLSEEYVRGRVERYTSIERIRSNVDKETGDRIRSYGYAGVKVDEDYKRYYPYGELASKVLGFTGGDNQGIIGLEVMYEEYLSGTPGQILTVTDARGIEVPEEGERRREPIAGDDLVISIDANIQMYAQQLAEQAMVTKEAESVSIIVMRPNTGEILAMTNVPEFDLNHPFELNQTGRLLEISISDNEMTSEERQDALNRMWRNGCINDTYEPGSTFKIITAAAALEEGIVTLDEAFHCPGFIVVDDRRIRCHKVQGHGSETFLQGFMNSCNPVFVGVGLRLGVERYYDYFEQFGLLTKTGIDLPGEAATIMHKEENIGPVELATISFGQSFQITPIQLATTVSEIINGGTRVTPHFGVCTQDAQGNINHIFDYPVTENVVSSETSETMRYMLEQVVSNGGGRNGYVEGFLVGGKTATSQTLPRSNGVYIASFIGFAPADDPQVLAIAIINHPQGTYYGGQIAAPLVRQLFENILPYLEIEPYISEEQ